MPDGSRLNPEARLSMISGSITAKVSEINQYRVEDLGFGHVWESRRRTLAEIRDLADEMQEIADGMTAEDFASGQCDFHYESAVSQALDARS